MPLHWIGYFNNGGAWGDTESMLAILMAVMKHWFELLYIWRASIRTYVWKLPF